MFFDKEHFSLMTEHFKVLDKPSLQKIVAVWAKIGFFIHIHNSANPDLIFGENKLRKLYQLCAL